MSLTNQSTPGAHTPEEGVQTPLTEAVLRTLSNNPQALKDVKKRLRPYVYAVMAFKKGRKFQATPALRTLLQGEVAPPLTTLFIGISAVFNENNTQAAVAVAIHDAIYLLDYSVQTITLATDTDAIANYVIKEVTKYCHENLAKVIGAGIPFDLLEKSPTLCSRLWLELDVVPISIMPEVERVDINRKKALHWDAKGVDEQADSMARKVVMHFGPTLSSLLQVGYRGIVEIDAGFQAHILRVEDFKTTCGDATWNAMMKFVVSLKGKGTKIAFFSSTPQGGGVALMRHALVRLARLLGVDLTWYVPKPKPGVFRITKNVHNILQGVSKPDEWISAEDKKVLTGWIEDNANRYWLNSNGPLRPAEEGGADVIFIDDPQMPGLIPLIKRLTPNRPVIYRSHIQIRSDLVATPGTPQADIWEFLWGNIKHSDMFISHPIPSFVPKNVPREKVCYLPATTDWLDGLNKDIGDWDRGYYINLYNDQCHTMRMTELEWPARKYIIQVARFDPAKGIPDVIKSYAEFRRLLSLKSSEATEEEAPQLVICGNGSVDDPDGTQIYAQTMSLLQTTYPSLLPDISVMRLPPNDQLLNALLSSATICLQLSTREGFEVKVSEALHAGIPVIATRTGGIPLQIQEGKTGFLVEPGDWKAVAGYLMELWEDEEKLNTMKEAARVGVSDEVGTVGNALAWFYLADVWTRQADEKSGKGVVPEGRWVNDLAREEVGAPYEEGENRLPRSFTQQ